LGKSRGFAVVEFSTIDETRHFLAEFETIAPMTAEFQRSFVRHLPICVFPDVIGGSTSSVSVTNFPPIPMFQQK
jgi:hypothetical protein